MFDNTQLILQTRMPSFFKCSSTRGVQKMPAYKQNPLFCGLKTTTKSYFNSIVSKRWFSVPEPVLAPVLVLAPAPASAPAAPISNVFETSDCIWYYGTMYVKEAVAVEKLHKQQIKIEQHKNQVQDQDQVQDQVQDLSLIHI